MAIKESGRVIRYLIRIFLMVLLCIVIGNMMFAVTGSEGFAEVKAPDDHVEGEAIVVFRRNVPLKQVRMLAGGGSAVGTSGDPAGLTQKSEVLSSRAVLIKDSSKDTQEIVDEMSALDEVAYAQPNYLYELQEKNEVRYDVSITGSSLDRWNFRNVNAGEAWDLIDALDNVGMKRKGRVKLAVIDTGINYNHEDMQKNVDRSECVRTVSGQVEPYTPSASQDIHGTKLTSVIAADANNWIGIDGIASGPKNDLITVSSINVFEKGKRKKQYHATTANLIAGLEYARLHDAELISFAFGAVSDFKDYYGEPHDDEAMKEEFKRVEESGIPIVCGGGNQAKAAPCYPADLGYAITAIATKNYYNAWRNVKKDNSNYGLQKTVSAPGIKIPACQADGKYNYISCTSAASAHVTSVAALMLAVDPELTPYEVKSIISRTATDVYKTGRDKMTGYGVVNAYAAVRETALQAAALGRLHDAHGRVISAQEVMELADRTKPRSFGKKLARPRIRSIKKGKKKLTLKFRYSTFGRLSGIDIYRAKSKNSSYKLVKRLKSGKKKWTDTGLRTHKKYFYKIKIRCTSNDGKKLRSPYSKAVGAKTR